MRVVGWTLVCLLALEPSVVFCASPYGPLKFWPELNKLPVISPVRWVYSESVENRNSWFVFMVSCEQVPAYQGEKNIFIEEEEELGRDIVNRVLMAFHWLSLCWKEVFPLTLGTAIFSVMRAPPSYLPTIFNWCSILFIFLIFLQAISEICHFFSNCHSILSFPSCLDVHFIEFFFLFYEFWLCWIPCGSWASL